jgi:dual specificity tyrosine-phosphorylation-regulated kinase 2/3/4
MTVGSGDHHGEKTPTNVNPSRNMKNLQPLRLPPLNLLPLSTPTAARIANFPTPSGEVDEREGGAITPPPKRNYTKTPSTPMTASKASFFGSKKEHDYDDDQYDMFKRSASSTHIMMPSHEQQYGGSRPFGLSPTTPVAIPSPFPRNNAHTPFASSSLPKPAADFGQLPFRNAEQDVHTMQFDGTKTTEVLPSPKPQTLLVKKDSASTRTSTSDEPSTPASTSSNLRRKLSLSWKRSSSKASQRAKAEAEKAEKEAKEEMVRRGSKQSQTDMPPPKLPASATWNGNYSPTVADSQQSSSRPSFERFGRKASGQASVKDGNMAEAFNNAPELKPSASGNLDLPPGYNDHRRATSRSTSSSVLTPMQRILGTKSSLGTLKARHLDTNLDKDDLAADKIMEKMGSKRKDFDHAAKELDALRRRALPRDKLSPHQASATWDLNIFERGEIIDYKDVYFSGTKNARKHVGDLNHATNNFGYDDERGDYNIVLGDHLAYRYEVVDMLGKGSFGQVVRCVDHKTGMLVAIKIIRNKKRFHQQALVEVNILQKLREWVSLPPPVLLTARHCGVG